MNHDETKDKLFYLIEARNRIEQQIKETAFNYCKKEGLVSTSLEIDNFGYKNKIREVFHLVI